MTKRRLRSAAGPDVDPVQRPMRPAPALAITAGVIALAVAAGIALSSAARPVPAPAFAGCRTAAQLAPRLYSGPPAMCIHRDRSYLATINTSKGKVSVVFLVGSSPITVNNFIVLAENGFFTGLPFWRLQDWVVQSGDPQGDGRGGPGYTLPEEPATTGEKWPPGSLGMARPPGGPINGSQFFITRGEWPGGVPTTAYNHFATVTLGFDILTQLQPGDRILGVDVRENRAEPSPSPTV